MHIKLKPQFHCSNMNVRTVCIFKVISAPFSLHMVVKKPPFCLPQPLYNSLLFMSLFGTPEMAVFGKNYAVITVTEYVQWSVLFLFIAGSVHYKQNDTLYLCIVACELIMNLLIYVCKYLWTFEKWFIVESRGKRNIVQATTLFLRACAVNTWGQFLSSHEHSYGTGMC